MIWLNLLVTGIAVVPFLLEGLARLSPRISGDWPKFVWFFAFGALDAIGTLGYVVCWPVLLSACILLLTPRIPWKVKLVTASLELGACALLFWDVGKLEPLHHSLS